MKILLDKLDDLETLAINKIQKTCCDDCQHAATRTTEELTTGLRRAIRLNFTSPEWKGPTTKVNRDPSIPSSIDPNGTVTP